MSGVFSTNTTRDSNATTAAANATTPAPGGGRAPFCLNCGFNFGHVADGIDDAAAGALIVSIFVLLLAVICFGVGFAVHAHRVRHAHTYAAVGATDHNTAANASTTTTTTQS
jgi:hypothetical protein